MRSSKIHIGIDLDNTIFKYDEVFHALALDDDLISSDCSADKYSIREQVRSVHGEQTWQWIQFQAYGPQVKKSLIFEGVGEFLDIGTKLGYSFSIVSHKTQFSSVDKERSFDLRLAAIARLKNANILGADGYLSSKDIYFAETRVEKIEKIIDLNAIVSLTISRKFFYMELFPIASEKYYLIQVRKKSMIG